MFQLHDTVVLRSGGPVLTVIGFSPQGWVWCQWTRGDLRTLDDKPVIEEASFLPEQLILVE